MTRIAPELNFKVNNTLKNDDTQFGVNLKFKSMDDFDPARVAEQVPALKALMETRNKLRDLMTKVDRSEALEGLLEQVLQNEEQLKKFSSDLGLDQSKESK
jgi:type VI secretion system protein ImpB